MKYNNNGIPTDIYIKTFDTLPVGAEVDYTGSVVPDGWTQVDSYSTSEVNTGQTWINGKTIYRKVIKYTPTETIGATGQQTNIDIAHNITNMEQCINCILFNNNHYRFPIISGTSSLTSGTEVLSVHPTSGIRLRIINDTWSTNNTFYFILEYTKTN